MEKEIKIFFAGDFCSKPSTSLIEVSNELKEIIKKCDIKIINFEVPLKPDNITLKPQKRERFYQNDDSPEFLYNLGFNLFTIANNHLFDFEKYGYEKTKLFLGDDSFGAGLYDEAYKIKKVKINNITIGFYSLTYNAYKGVFSDYNNHEGLGCAYINDLRVNHDIINAKKEVDYLFILVHDGIEYVDVPMEETIARYRDFIDYGADGVIGTHPHCPQGWELYKNKPIFYSLGNFFFNSKENTLYRVINRPHWYEGRCVILTISNNNINYEILNIKNIDNIKIEIDKSNESKVHNEKICNYLQNKKLYNDYITPILEKKINNEITLFNKKNKELLFLLKNDLRLKNIIKNYNFFDDKKSPLISNIENKYKLLPNKKELSNEQEIEIKSFFNDLINEEVPINWHKYFYSRNDIYSKKYLPQTVTNKLIKMANKCEYRDAYADKNIMNIILPNVKHPKIILKNINGYYYFNNKPVSKEDALKLCNNLGKVIFKPSLLSRGMKVNIINIENGLTDYNNFTLSEVFDYYSINYCVQEIIEQHEKMKNLNPTSINTIRILSYRSNMDIIILYAIVRIGRKNKNIDNESQGSISVKINHNGLLNKYGVGKSEENKIEKTDNGITLEGYEIPSYDKALKLIKEQHYNLPFFNLIAWDVAIGYDGEPILIEYNVLPGLSQSAVGPAFGIYTEKIIKELYKNNGN